MTATLAWTWAGAGGRDVRGGAGTFRAPATLEHPTGPACTQALLRSAPCASTNRRRHSRALWLIITIRRLADGSLSVRLARRYRLPLKPREPPYRACRGFHLPETAGRHRRHRSWPTKPPAAPPGASRNGHYSGERNFRPRLLLVVELGKPLSQGTRRRNLRIPAATPR